MDFDNEQGTVFKTSIGMANIPESNTGKDVKEQC